MADLSTLASDDDTGRIEAIMRETGSDPARDIKALRIAFARHEHDDRRAWRIVLWIAGLMLTASVAMLGAAWSAAEDSGRAAERVESIARDVARIEAHMDRIEERTARSREE